MNITPSKARKKRRRVLLVEQDTLETLIRACATITEAQHDLNRQMQRILDRPPPPFTYVDNRGANVENKGDTHFHGSVGAVAMDHATQVVGEINQQIAQQLAALDSDPETKPVADVLKRLTDEITASKEVPSEYERESKLRDINELTRQAALPKEKRQKAAAAPIIDRLAGFCGGIGGLATLWQVAGPALLALF